MDHIIGHSPDVCPIYFLLLSHNIALRTPVLRSENREAMFAGHLEETVLKSYSSLSASDLNAH